MSTQENIKNPHIVMDEIIKRLNRIAGGSSIARLHDALRLAKEDTTKFLEALDFVKVNVVKVSQPTHAGGQIVKSIVELIDSINDNLTEDEKYILNESHLVESDEESEDADTVTSDEKIIVDQSLLDVHPELVDQVEIGEVISFTGIDETSTDTENETAITNDDDILNDPSFIEFNDKQKATSVKTVVDDDALNVKASKTFDGKKTKLTKKLLSTYPQLGANRLVIGDVVYIQSTETETLLTAYIATLDDKQVDEDIEIGSIIIFDKPIHLLAETTN